MHYSTPSIIPACEISEIFSSIQGEGPFLGKKQIFVRFGRCNMHCHYCDELEKMQKEVFSSMELHEVLEEISQLESTTGKHHSISLTGGEPLFYSKFLKYFLPQLKQLGHKTYLETNGTLPQQLESVIDWIDIIAMDMKPQSSSQDRDYLKEHSSFLHVAKEKNVFVKVVVTPETLKHEVIQCAEIVQSIHPRAPFILQPQSELTGISVKSLQFIENDLIKSISSILNDVRVIPQMHKVWGVR